MKHKRIYLALVNYGFSPLYAAQILLDCKRGNAHARVAVVCAVRARRK